MNEDVKADDKGAETEAETPKGAVYLVLYDGEYKNVTVEGFDTKELAIEAAGKSPREKSLVIQEANDLVQFDPQTLLSIYNGINNSTLTRFRTVESGRERILTSVRGLVASQTKGEQSTGAEASESESDVATKKKKAAAKAPAEKKKRKSAIDLEKKIHHTAAFKDAKLREGSSRSKDFEKMKNGLKVSTYLDNKGNPNNLRFAIIKKYITLGD